MKLISLATGLVVAVSAWGYSIYSQAAPEASRAAGPVAALRLAPTLDLEGKIYALEQNDAQRVRAFVFVGTECPIARSYAPELNRLAQEFAGSAQMFGVWSEADVTPAAARKHFAEFKVRFPILNDSARVLASEFKPTHMPMAYVVNADGHVIYRGAIDNAWETVGRRRAQVEKRYLRDALRAALAGKPVPVAKTQGVGCVFEVPKSEAVTFARDVAPVVFTRCMNCHRDGQAAPFSLTNYAQTAKRARMIADVTKERIMPPWIPTEGHERFVGDRWLTARELEIFRRWATQGAPEGERAALPVAPHFAEGWRLGKPDLIVKMPQPFVVRADGPDILQNIVIPVPTTEDKLVAAVEFHPGNPRVVHHAVLFLDDKGAARALDARTPEVGYENFGGPGFVPSGALGGWSVGNTARRLPNGMGRYLKAGSDLVVQMHYHPTGKEESDQSEIGIYFVDKPVAEAIKEPAKLVGSIWMANYEMDIPAGEANYRRDASYTLPRDVIMVGVVPHMHLLGRSMKVTATLPDGTTKVLVDVPRWNYNWQDEYYYEKPFRLPAGTRLKASAVFDNSAQNPSNPSSPPRRVTWGDGTLDEMLFCFFLLTSDKTEDVIHVILDNIAHDQKQPRAAVARNN